MPQKVSRSKKPKIKIAKWRKDPGAIEKYQFVHHFLPHPETKERARLLSFKAFLIYIVLIILVTGIFRMVPSVFPGVLGYASNINVRDLLEGTNYKRGQSGLPDLMLNEELTLAAQEKAEHMFENNYWAHVAPDGTEPWDFILGEEYDYVYAGENLAKNFHSSRDVVNAWEESPTHRENLLGENYDEVGFAVVNGVLDGYETTLVVQMFGRPRNLSLIATAAQEEALLNQVSPRSGTGESAIPTSAGSSDVAVTSVEEPAPTPQFVDITMASRGIAIAFAGFIIMLLILDVWYSSRKGILKFTGKTFAHLVFLVFVVLSIWFVLKPGAVL
jgi:hypothetical protein